MCQLKRGLIVSCQATDKEPLYGFNIMHLFAKCAVLGGAVGIRALCDDVESIKNTVDVPVIGLVKKNYPDSEIYITPTKVEVESLINSGCDCIAIDATLRARPDGETLASIVEYVRKKAPNMYIMADVDDLESALNADKLGFNYISTTLRGYTPKTTNCIKPDINFIKELIAKVKAQVIVEGGIWETEQLKAVSLLKPYAVVIGTSITRPMEITKRFVESLAI